MKRVSMLLLIIAFMTSCNGQPRPSVTFIQSDAQRKTGKQPKMIRTQGIQFGNVGCELQDKDGYIWFSTSGEGIYRYDPTGRSFTNFTTKDGLNSNYVNVMIQDKAGNILAGTNDGISKYEPSAMHKAGAVVFTPFTDNEGINKSTIWSLLEDKEGRLWIGTMERGVYCCNGKKISNFLNDGDPHNPGVHHQAIRDMLQDKKGNIWFCSWNGGGVWRYDASGSFKNFRPSADYYLQNEDGRSFNKPKNESNTSYMPKPFADCMPTDCIHDDMIFSASEDKAGNIWFATRRHGACRYSPSTESFTSFREKEGFVSYGVYDILEDKKGRIWLTTDRNGVWCYHPSAALQAGSKTFINYTMNEGLVDNSVFSVLEDKRGNIWFGTRNFGLSCYDGKKFIAFSQDRIEDKGKN